MSKTHRTPHDGFQYAAAYTFTSEGGRLPAAAGERRMTDLGIRREVADDDDRGFHHGRLGEADQALMASLDIVFDGRAFWFAGSRHERLADAVAHARRAGMPH